MTELQSDSLEYLSGAFKGLSAEKKDSVLEAARSLLKIQEDDNALATKIVPQSEREDFEFIEFGSSYAGEKTLKGE